MLFDSGAQLLEKVDDLFLLLGAFISPGITGGERDRQSSPRRRKLNGVGAIVIGEATKQTTSAHPNGAIVNQPCYIHHHISSSHYLIFKSLLIHREQ